MKFRNHQLSNMVRFIALVALLVNLMIVPAHADSSFSVESFAALEGQVSVLVLRDGDAMAEGRPSAIASLNPEQPLAVASAFKLSVLEALQNQINAGKHTWDEVVPLSPQAKSLPSGILQAWPDQTPITLQTLATLMISISDNTAADALIKFLGPALSGDAQEPLLTTRQAFALKNPDNQELLETYRKSENRRALLTQIDVAPLPSVELVDTVPVAPDVEWFFSVRSLCQSIQNVADLPLMQINTGIIDPTPWQQVAFKGGAEPGVLNLTAALTSNQGYRYCVSATWNDDQPLEEYRFFQAYSDLVAALSNAD